MNQTTNKIRQEEGTNRYEAFPYGICERCRGIDHPTAIYHHHSLIFDNYGKARLCDSCLEIINELI